MAVFENIPAGAPWCAAPDPAPRPPGFIVPLLACDCHAHICGPIAEYNFDPERIYTPPDALLPAYQAMLKVLGMQRAVLVQPSVYGTDNTVLMHALAEDKASLRGVAVVEPDINDHELKHLDAAGVRGVRINVVDRREGRNVVPLDEIVPLARRIAPMGWHVELLLQADAIADLPAVLAAIPTNVVLGHLGYLHASKGGVSHPKFMALLRALESGRVWIKLTGPYRISAEPAPYPDMLPMARALAAAAPERLIWGSDWPHVMVPALAMPNDGMLLDLLENWLPDISARQKVLVDSPAALYGFQKL